MMDPPVLLLLLLLHLSPHPPLLQFQNQLPQLLQLQPLLQGTQPALKAQEGSAAGFRL